MAHTTALVSCVLLLVLSSSLAAPGRDKAVSAAKRLHGPNRNATIQGAQARLHKIKALQQIRAKAQKRSSAAIALGEGGYCGDGDEGNGMCADPSECCYSGYCSACSGETYCGDGNYGNGICEDSSACCYGGYCEGCGFGTCGNGYYGDGVCSDYLDCCSSDGYCNYCYSSGSCGNGNVGDGTCPDYYDCCSSDGYCNYCYSYGTCGGGYYGDGYCSDSSQCCSWDGYCTSCDDTPCGDGSFGTTFQCSDSSQCCSADGYCGDGEGYCAYENCVGGPCMPPVTGSPPPPGPPGAIGEGDPHFSGFDGAWFDFPGYADAVFAVMSSPKYQVNALFSNLGNVRVMNNYMTQAAFMAPGSAAVVEVAAGGGKLALWVAGRPRTDIAALLTPGVSYRIAPGLVACLTPQHPKGREGVTIDLIGEELALSVFTASGEPWLDLSLHLRSASFPDAHGIVGQTWRGGKGVAPTVVNGSHVLEGESDADYEVTDGILGGTFRFSQYQGHTYATKRAGKLYVAGSGSSGAFDGMHGDAAPLKAGARRAMLVANGESLEVVEGEGGWLQHVAATATYRVVA